MTDNEIIKVLEKFKCVNCNGDCAKESYEDLECPLNLVKSALDLIKRQKAEIETLTNKLEQQQEMMANLGVELTTMRGSANSYKMHYEKAQAELERLHIEGLQINKTFMDFVNKQIAEAIKEFWKKLKKYCKREICFFTPEDERELIKWGNNLVKEMVGE